MDVDRLREILDSELDEQQIVVNFVALEQMEHARLRMKYIVYADQTCGHDLIRAMWRLN
jgi:hypothetical protein